MLSPVTMIRGCDGVAACFLLTVIARTQMFALWRDAKTGLDRRGKRVGT